MVRHAGTEDQPEELKIPYQILGESLATASVLTLRGYRVSSQQVTAGSVRKILTSV